MTTARGLGCVKMQACCGALEWRSKASGVVSVSREVRLAGAHGRRGAEVPKDTDPAEADQSANWSEQRKRYAALKAEQNARGAWLLANNGQPVTVQGRWKGFKRNRGTAALRAKKRAR